MLLIQNWSAVVTAGLKLPPNCQRCGGQWLEDMGDMCCLQCGNRLVGEGSRPGISYDDIERSKMVNGHTAPIGDPFDELVKAARQVLQKLESDQSAAQERVAKRRAQVRRLTVALPGGSRIGMKRLTEEDRVGVLNYYSCGWTIDKIAQHYSVAKSTVYRVMRERRVAA